MRTRARQKRRKRPRTAGRHEVVIPLVGGKAGLVQGRGLTFSLVTASPQRQRRAQQTLPRRGKTQRFTRYPGICQSSLVHQNLVSSLGIPVAADNCDATLVAVLKVESVSGIACRAPSLSSTYTPYEIWPSASYSIVPSALHSSSGQSTVVFLHRPKKRREIFCLRAATSISADHWRDTLKKRMVARNNRPMTVPPFAGTEDAFELLMAKAAAATRITTRTIEPIPGLPEANMSVWLRRSIPGVVSTIAARSRSEITIQNDCRKHPVISVAKSTFNS
jgi:hypothetical protein